MSEENDPSGYLTLSDVTRVAQESLLVRGGYPPTAIVEGDQGTVAAQLEPLAPTAEERVQQMFILGFTLARSGEVGVLHQVFFISEAWLSAGDIRKPIERLPSQDPKRKEVLIVAHHTVRPPMTEVVVFEMKRAPQGTLTSLEPLHPEAQQETISSPLIEALVIGFLGSVLRRDD